MFRSLCRSAAVPLLLLVAILAAMPMFNTVAADHVSAEVVPRFDSPVRLIGLQVAIAPDLQVTVDSLAVHAATRSWSTCITAELNGTTLRVRAADIEQRSCRQSGSGHAIPTTPLRPGRCIPTAQEGSAFDASGEDVRLLVCSPGSRAVIVRPDWLFSRPIPIPGNKGASTSRAT